MEVNIIPIPSQPVICDFCASPDSRTYEHPCADFQLDKWEYRSVGLWKACHTCHELIIAERWDDLKRRAADLFVIKAGATANRTLTVEFVNDLHDAFRQHRTI